MTSIFHASLATTDGAPGHPGLFIALEGGDGAGKSTQIALLAQKLEHIGADVVVTREPGGCVLSEKIRQLVLDPSLGPVDPRTEALLFAAARSSHVNKLIRPALARGAVVIADRYIDSSVAYQGAGRDLGVEPVRDLNMWAAEGLLPDLTVLLDVHSETGARRRRERVADRMEQESQEFHDRVRQAFVTLAHHDPARYAIFDAETPVSVLAENIFDAVYPLLPERRSA